MKTLSWVLWGIVSLLILGYYGYELVYKPQKPNFLPGAVTHGHFQIELACDACHTDPFGGGEVLQDACLNCHEEELKISLDSHPRKKFTDPRNADLLEILDARYCTTCHMEHQDAMISEMGVSLPGDYCYHCHQEIGEDRESHKDLPYDSCQSAGCHNYHDNRALYEDFLAKHSGEPDFKAETFTAPDYYQENLDKLAGLMDISGEPLSIAQADHGSDDKQIMNEWVHSSHGKAGVNCQQCHGSGDKFVEIPQPEGCRSCHEYEVQTFLQGKHGMRLAAGLSPMSPEQSSLPMHTDEHKELSCNSCHKAHEFATDYAKVDACLGCHNDEHSLAYKDSKHFQRLAEGQDGITCAGCHMPKVEVEGGHVEGYRVNHNQNDTLRPNEKMIRPVCLNCHGLQFSLNALADPELVESNFKGMPSIHIESIEWVEKRNHTKRDSIY